jgi:hypothetical protein
MVRGLTRPWRLSFRQKARGRGPGEEAGEAPGADCTEHRRHGEDCSLWGEAVSMRIEQMHTCGVTETENLCHIVYLCMCVNL